MKKIIQDIVDKVKALLPDDKNSTSSPFGQFLAEIEKGVGSAAQECKKLGDRGQGCL